MAGLLALRARQAASAGRLERWWGFRVAFTEVVLGTLDGIGVYWIGPFWWAALGFSFGAFLVPALLLLRHRVPAVRHRVAQAKAAPSLGEWLLIAGGLLAIILLVIVLGQLSLGLMVLNLAWVVLGYSLYSEKAVPARQPAHAA